MNYVYAALLAALLFRWTRLLLLTLVAIPITPVLVLLVLPFAKQTTRASGINCLPSWAAFLNTPDDPTGEQGMYEPAVAAKMKYGWRVKTLYWLGWRNQMYGLFFRLAPVAPAVALLRYSNPFYPNSKGPYTPGFCCVTMRVDGELFWEVSVCWPWSSTKCANPRFGYKLHEMAPPGPIVFMCQPQRLWLTRDSTT